MAEGRREAAKIRAYDDALDERGSSRSGVHPAVALQREPISRVLADADAQLDALTTEIAQGSELRSHARIAENEHPHDPAHENALGVAALPSLSPTAAAGRRRWLPFAWGVAALVLALCIGLAPRARRLGPPALPRATQAEPALAAALVPGGVESAATPLPASQPLAEPVAPASGALLLSDAVAALRTGRPGTARALLAAASALDPLNPHVFSALAQAELLLGAPGRALAAAEIAAKLRPKRARYHLLRARVYDVLGQRSEADEARRQAEALQPVYSEPAPQAPEADRAPSAADGLPADVEQ